MVDVKRQETFRTWPAFVVYVAERKFRSSIGFKLRDFMEDALISLFATHRD